ncbi:hypothetical protein RM780_00280 [Streptomyces sp. DSM 44917]|uniref:DUF4760 domain-containing protein n=1 Tax=Streptomyces boetiae TaxID=3075541 RepID=A0ABU2L1H3_9ACTN|nr:hypothetical protein [Streptomyces sp. DSM 44917]MDT0305403.1 hypothetical protein [Streptomyces sp. DSM 44917]
MDTAVWVAALTGATAILASWVTNRGNARAARIQANAAADTQRRSEQRDSRRTAYLDLIERVHEMAEFYWVVSDTLKLQDPGERRAARKELLIRERQEYARFRRCVRLIDLEGPPQAAEAARELREHARSFWVALRALADDAVTGEELAAAEREFQECYGPYWEAFERFIQVAREVLRTT